MSKIDALASNLRRDFGRLWVPLQGDLCPISLDDVRISHRNWCNGGRLTGTGIGRQNVCRSAVVEKNLDVRECLQDFDWCWRSASQWPTTRRTQPTRPELVDNAKLVAIPNLQEEYRRIYLSTKKKEKGFVGATAAVYTWSRCELDLVPCVRAVRVETHTNDGDRSMEIVIRQAERP